MIGVIDDASRASFGRPDPHGVVTVAPIASSDELIDELRRVAVPGDAGARALEVLAARLGRSRERGIDLPLADALDAWQLSPDDRRLVAAALVAGLAGATVDVGALGALAGARVVAERLDAQAPLRRLALVSLGSDALPWPARVVTPAPRVFALAAGARGVDGELAAELVAVAEPPVAGDSETLAAACRRASAREPIALVHGLERQDDLVDRVARVAAALGRRVLVADGARVAGQLGPLAREALFLRAVVILRGGDAGVCAALARLEAPVVAVGGDAAGAIAVELLPLSAEERERQWRAALPGADATALAAAWRLGPATIRRLGERARAQLDGDGAAAAVRAALAVEWPQPPLARTVEPAASWDELFLPQAEGEAIVELLAAARASDGVVAAFVGPAGSGKTMTSALVARELGLSLWETSLRHAAAAVRAGHGGELAALLRAAEEGGALVALADADALAPGDDAALLTLVRWLPRTRATVLLHARGAIDPLLARAVRLELPFAAPDLATRSQLWLRALPELAEDARALASTPATGGQIVAWAARARARAALDGEPPALQHVRNLIERQEGRGHGR